MSPYSSSAASTANSPRSANLQDFSAIFLDKIMPPAYISRWDIPQRRLPAGVFAFWGLICPVGAGAVIKNRAQNAQTPKSLRMNTCESASKQSTLSAFKINTYTKTRGEGSTNQKWRTLQSCPPNESLFTPYAAPHRSVICPRISQSSGKNLCRMPSSRISTGRPFNDFDPSPIVR